MAEQRLPLVDGDDGQWGDILNQFLEKEHFNTALDNPDNGGHYTVTIQPGTANPGTAPLKFNAGPLMTTPEIGAIEFYNDRFYLTEVTNATNRRLIASYDDSSGAKGDIYYRDENANLVRLGIGSGSNILKIEDGIPTWGNLSEASLTFTDITTNDASNTQHGFAPKAVTPSAGQLNVLGIANGEATYSNKTIFSGLAQVTVGTTEPTNPSEGDIWIDIN